jgi:hypothetical protein
VRRVRSLGIDGGARYSADFEDLARHTLLANGQPGFDLQFQGIARTILRTGVDFAPLDSASPIVVCVPSTEANRLPDRVLEFTARKHTSISVHVHPIRSPLDLETIPAAATDVPSMAGGDEYHRVIVLRSGSVVLDDLRKLWVRPLEREVVEVPRVPYGSGVPDQPAVSVLTAAGPGRLGAMLRAAVDLGRSPAGPSRLESVLPVTASLSGAWDRQDRLGEGDNSVLVYAAAGLQPWISRAHPLAHLWVANLLEAVREGFVSLDLIRTEVRLGHVRPSLLEQVERGSLEGLLVSWSARRLDAAFTPPIGPPARQPRLLTEPLLVLRTLARHARRQLGAYRRRHMAGGV